ncbi:MAG: hypothetical protein JKY65_03430 [Planctomycetes bacterium]|nr:hypothetical protein [Planctomycetota bacterium]
MVEQSVESNWGGIKDPALARDLIAAGVPPERVTALMVYPAVHAAWADGSVRVLETLALMVASIRAGLEREDFEFVLGWTRERPENPEALLDLTWRLFECLPALQQRASPELAWSSARMVARCSGGVLGLFSIGEAEQTALETVREYTSGAGLETARRVALTWECALESQIPGLSSVRPEEVEGASGSPLESTLRGALAAIQKAPRMREVSAAGRLGKKERRDFMRALKRENDRDLLPSVREAYESLSDGERVLIGEPTSLQEITPWQACRLALLIVCRSAQVPAGAVDADALIAAQASGDSELLERSLGQHLKAMVEHDRALTPALLRTLVDGECVEFVCRHYVRMVGAVYRALGRTAAGLRDTYLIPLYGIHDARVRQSHAWCLFVDAKRGVACPIDPQSADVWWDAGHAESFLNPLLAASNYANLSALLVRFLLASQEVGVEAACQLVQALPPEQRPLVATRLLVQWPLTQLLDEKEFAACLAGAAAHGAPEAFLERARELRGTDPEILSIGESKTLRRRLGRFLVAASFSGSAELAASLKKTSLFGGF